MLLPNWAAIWGIPLAVTVVFLLVFVAFFREDTIAQPEPKVEPAGV